ncbi:iron ABC transporter permease [Berryella wangjianweii]|uniref:Probable heme-iron transport system permease protein IsdF n=1 Tax=Berryella wangjianweii TaxID=2734634 RepID=A0A6M8J000_9ACTN|nr:iron ABC transporter permease [Berryella wangjianweii]QKF07290.1 iron ABC transporter permease [Berryella wangjianweii]
MIGTARRLAVVATTLVALVALFVVAVNTGTLKVDPVQLFNGLFVAYDDSVAAIYDLRFPRILIALVGGAALAVSGVLLQAVIRNPLADPGIIGVSAGAGFAAILVTAFFPALFYLTPILACVGGFVAFALVYTLSWHAGTLQPLRIILVGIAVSALFSGLSAAFSSGTGGVLSGVARLVDANITMKTWSDLQSLAAYALPCLAVTLLLTKRCDLLLLEDKTAQALGVDVPCNRLAISVVAVVLASITTAIIGPISFLGLVVPHCARLLVGTAHRWLVPFSALLGAFTLLLADTVGRTIAAPYEISAAVIMSVIGGPAFIVLLKKARGSYGQ